MVKFQMVKWSNRNVGFGGFEVRIGMKKMMREIGMGLVVGGGVGALVLGMGGCVGDNQRLTLGHDVELSSLAGESAGSGGGDGGGTKYSGNTDALAHASGELQQRSWEGQEFVVPVDRVGHRAVMWRREIVMPTKTARQRGEYPTPETALDLSGPSGGKPTHTTQAAETLLATPMGVVGDTVLLVPRLVRPGPAGRKGSPRWGYERAPEAGVSAWRGGEEAVVPGEGEVPAVPVMPSSGGSASDAPAAAAMPVNPAAVPAAAVPATAPAGDEQLPVLPAAAKGASSGGGSGGAEKPK
jgi:hypothetical protein